MPVAAVCSKAVILLLMSHCLLLIPLFMEVCVWPLFCYALELTLFSSVQSSY